MAIKELKSVVLGSEDISKSPIIGTFEGECADGLVTNANNMDIPVEVWTTLFNSDTYKQAIELGWYIGFLGHPDDPNCMDFRNACIVMTEGHIDDDGKVYGKFNLIDTPVGRIVKSFIDAGVTFGISVRGVGETTPNGISESVNPDSFVFRGFDLVAFPAFENAIPEFQALAASSKVESQIKYKKICASIDANLPDITSPTAIETIKEQFSPNSAEYAMLDERISELGTEYEEQSTEFESVEQQKFDGLYKLYQEANDEIAELESTIESDASYIADLQTETDYADKKIQIFESTINNQNAKLRKITAKYEARNKALITANSKMKKENAKLIQGNTDLQAENAGLKSKNKQLREVMASQETKISDMASEMSESNLKYNREIKSAKKKIESATQTISEQEQSIKELQSQLSETVKQRKIEATKSLDRDDENETLRKELVKVKKVLAGYQSAYVDLYQSASGIDLSNIPITASTSIDDLHRVINQQTGVPIMASSEVEPSILFEDCDSDGTIVSL